MSSLLAATANVGESETTQTHQTLCCRITTIDFYNFKNFKFNDFNKEPTSSLKMIWIMIETCWRVFKCFNTDISD